MLEIQNLSFQHHASDAPALRNLSLEIEPGMILAVVGPSGSGKSTLLRAMNGLVPHFHGGRIGGSVRVDGIDTRISATADLSRTIGFMSQEPEAQTVFDTVVDEIAFGPENLGYGQEEIRSRVNDALGLLQIDHLRDRDVSTLSGGERQRTVIAATLAMGSRVLILDEPLSQLDPWAAEDLLETLQRVNSVAGVTIVIAEHRIDRLLPHCSHALELASGSCRSGLQSIADARSTLAHRPALSQLAELLEWPEHPVTVAEAQSLHVRHGPSLPLRTPSPTSPERPILDVRHASVVLGGSGILRDINLSAPKASVTALMGRNGAGKTTLLRAIAGLQSLDSGEITLENEPVGSIQASQRSSRIGFVPQFPAALFLGETVAEEVEISLGSGAARSRIRAMLDRFNLEHLADRYPWDISGGERQRLALAIAMAPEPQILLLDEPTRGMDQPARNSLQTMITNLRETETSVIISTHDCDLAAHCADQVIMIDRGTIVSIGAPETALTIDPVLLPDVANVLGNGYLTLEQVATVLQNQRIASTFESIPTHRI